MRWRLGADRSPGEVISALERATEAKTVAAPAPPVPVTEQATAVDVAPELPRPRGFPRQVTSGIWAVGVLALTASGAWLMAADVEVPVTPPTEARAPSPLTPPAKGSSAAEPAPRLTVPAEKPSEEVTVTFGGDVRATAYEGDLIVGTLPLSLRRPLGSLLELRFKAEGYQDKVVKLKLESNAQLQVNLEKRAAPPSRPAKRPEPERSDLKSAPWMEGR